MPSPPRRLLGWLAGPAVAATVLLVVGPAPTLADCAAAPALADALKTAPVAFVGTVTSTANEARWATVKVEEVWVGPDQPAAVLVRGGPESGASSIDRTFDVGARYLFLPAVDSSGLMTDNICTSTTRFDALVASLRPATVRTPVGGPAEARGFDIGPLLGPVAVVAVVVVALLLIGLAARGRAD